MATHQNLEMMVKEGKFRKDLYYRLKTFEIYLPPLRERKEDIPLLANHFLKLFKEQGRAEVNGISDEAMNFLMFYDWPGNVRELKQCIEHSILKAKLSGQKIIEPEHLSEEIKRNIRRNGRLSSQDREFPIDINLKLAELEVSYISDALKISGKKTEAWKLLGYSNRFALRRKVLTIFKKYPQLKDSYRILYELFVMKDDLI